MFMGREKSDPNAPFHPCPRNSDLYFLDKSLPVSEAADVMSRGVSSQWSVSKCQAWSQWLTRQQWRD